MATATKGLTPRQQEVKKLLDQGKSPREIAKKLNISENAVYQQRRRIKGQQSSNGDQPAAPQPAAPRRSSGARKRSSTTKTRQPQTRQRRTNRQTTAAPSRPVPAAAPAATPLDAILQRRSEIEGQLAESETRLGEVRAAYEAVADSHDKLAKEHAAELENLTRAEQALSGKWPKPARQQRKQAEKAPEAEAAAEPEPASDGGAPEQATVDPTPEAEAEPAEAEAVAAQDEEEESPGLIGETEAPEMERPGAPTMPEFQQTSDAF